MVSTKMEIELTAKVARMYKSGVRVKKILNETGITLGQFQHLIYRKLESQKFHPRKPGKTKSKKDLRPITDWEMQRIEQLFRFGYEASEIAEDLNLTTKQVKDVRDQNLSKQN